MADGGENLDVAAVERVDPDDYFTYKPGFIISEGRTISSTVLVAKKYVVYNVKENFITYWSANELEPGKSTKLSEIDAILSEANNKLKNVFNDKIDALYTAAICAVFENYPPEGVDEKIKHLTDEVEKLTPYLRVIESSSRICIWINDDLTVGYNIRFCKPLEQYACERLGQVEAYRETIWPRDFEINNLKKMSINLAVALQSALSQTDRDEINKIFNNLEDRITVFVENTVKSKHIIMTLSFSISLISCAYILYKMQWISGLLGHALVPIAGGFLGALLSVMARANAIKVSEQNPDKIILLQGAVRILVGGAFAFVGFACVEANLALGVFRGDLYSLLVLGVVCGFSERLVPELIDGFSTSAK